MRTPILLILTFLVNILYAQNSFISFSGYKTENKMTEPIRNVTDNGVNGVEVSYHFDVLKSIKTTNKSENYQKLYISNFSHIQDVGMPSMPAHIDLIAIPEGAEVNLKISHDVALVKSGYKIYPSLQPARDTEGAPEPEFEIDEAFYKSNQLFPAQPVEIKDIITIRGLRYAMVRIAPVQFNPATGQIFLHENLNFEVQFTSANRFIDCSKHSKNALNILANYPLNGQSIKEEANRYFNTNPTISSTLNSKEYIIITHSDFQAAADSLAKWKQQMGYSVEVISSSSWTTTQVKNEVHTRYSNWIPKPDYLVIIGDHQFVPAEMFTSPGNDPFGSDLYYVCMDGAGDYVPDMAKGRISANSSADALLQVSKMINYERNPITDTSFYQNGLNCAQYQDDNNDGYADRRFTHTSENIRDYTMSQGYSVERIYYTNNNITPTHYNNGYYSNGQAIPNVLLKINGFPWNGNSTTIKNSINAGKFYVFHRDHGYSGGSGWAHPYFVNSKIANLSNGDKLPVVFSINCHTGEFTLNSCFAETFMRKNNGGSVGVIAASYYSYSGYNDGLSIGLIDAIWSNPGLIPTFGSGGVSNPTVNPHTDIISMGDVVNHGLVREIQTWGGGNNGIRYTHELFHYFGDPAMKIWTESPQNLTASYNTIINCTDTALVITNCNDSDAIASLIGGNQLISSIQLQNGSGIIPLSNLQGTSFILTISGRNMRPLISNITVGGSGLLSSYISTTNPQCKGDSTGELNIYPACGTPPYQISWSSGDTSFSLQNLPAGDYIYSLTDSQNNLIADTVSIIEPFIPLQTAATISGIKCYLQGNGSITLNIQGGYSPYSCSWNTGSISKTINGLSANSYTVSVLDSMGCEIIESFVLNEPPPLNMATAFTNDITNNCSGTAKATISGGTPPYVYLWNDNNGSTTDSVGGLCKGMYKIIVTDSNSCKASRTVIIDNTVGVENSSTNVSIGIYPNPSEDGLFNISIQGAVNHKYQIAIYNNLGKLIYSEALNGQGNIKEKIDLRTQASGVYYLQISSDSEIIDTYNLIIK